jgi:hypothetical protein
MITYRREGDKVTLEFNRKEYDEMLMMIGYMAGVAWRAGDPEMFREWIKFANRMNRTNPDLKPYEIPPGEAGPVQ